MKESGLKNNVRKFRKDNGLTQQDLAEKVDVSRQTIIAIEKGNYTPSVFLVLKIAKILKVNTDELFYLS